MPYSIQEFAAEIKRKYPDYQDWPDDYLAKEVVRKHPEYSSWVDTTAAPAAPAAPPIDPSGFLNRWPVPGVPQASGAPTPPALPAPTHAAPSEIMAGAAPAGAVPHGVPTPAETQAQVAKLAQQKAEDEALGYEYFRHAAQPAIPSQSAPPWLQTLTTQTPEGYAAQQTGYDQGLVGTAGNVLQNLTDYTTGALAAKMRGRTLPEHMGRRVRLARDEMARKVIIKTAKEKALKGEPLTTAEEEALKSDPSFLEQLAEFGRTIRDNPDEFLAELGEQLVADGPLVVLTSRGVGAVVQAARRARQLAQGGKAAVRSARTVERITKPGRVAQVGEEVAEDIAAEALISYPKTAARGQDYGPADAVSSLIIGSAIGVPTGLARHAMDPRMDRPEFRQRVQPRAKFTEGAEQNPHIQGILRQLSALHDSPAAKDVQVQVEGDPAKAPRFTRENAPAEYRDLIPEDEEWVASGKLRGDKEIDLYPEADLSTLPEEVVHSLQRQIRKTNPQLQARLDAWAQQARQEGQAAGLQLPDGDELFGQAMAAHLGHADVYGDVARVRIPDDILAEVQGLLGDEKVLSALRGAARRGEPAGRPKAPEEAAGPLPAPQKQVSGAAPEAPASRQPAAPPQAPPQPQEPDLYGEAGFWEKPLEERREVRAEEPPPPEEEPVAQPQEELPPLPEDLEEPPRRVSVLEGEEVLRRPAEAQEAPPAPEAQTPAPEAAETPKKRQGLSLRYFQKAKEYLTKRDSQGRPVPPTDAEVLDWMRSRGDDMTIPERRRVADDKKGNLSIAKREEATQFYGYVEALLKAGDADLRTNTVKASELPEEFTVGGTALKRVSTRTPGLIRYKVKGKQKTFDFLPHEEIHVDDGEYRFEAPENRAPVEPMDVGDDWQPAFQLKSARLEEGRLKVDPDEMSEEQLAKLDRILKRQGYDVRGAEDVRQLMKQRTKGYDPADDWGKAIQAVIGKVAGAPPAAKAERAAGVARGHYFPAALERKAIAKAKKGFGTTQDMGVAGYMTPDGALLNLSGGSTRGRGLDHRTVSQYLPDELVDEKSWTGNMYTFLKMGNIRLLPESGHAQLWLEPTAAQKARLRDWVRHHNGEVELEVGQGAFYKAYEAGTSPARILSDLEQHFRQVREDEGDAFQLRKPKEEAGQAEPEETREPKAGPVWYSQLERTLEAKMPNRADAQTIRGILKSGGVKEEEIKWTDLETFLKRKEGEKISKEEVLWLVRGNRIELEEKVLGQQEPEWYYSIHGRDSDERFPTEDAAREAAEKDYSERLREGFDERYTVSEDYTVSEEEGEDGNIVWEVYDRERGAAIERFDSEDDALSHLEEMFEEEVRDGMRQEVDVWEAEQEDLAKFEDYTEQGGKNYREILLHDPKITGTFRSSHFDTENIIAHARVKDRITKDGKKVLFVEEVQSDWHQAGRDKGYKSDPPPKGEIRRNEEADTWDLYVEGQYHSWARGTEEQARQLLKDVLEREASARERGRVPDAPFRKTWHEMVLRRLLRMAAEEGADYLAWTTGEQQNKRYSLTKQVDKLVYYNAEKYLVGYKDGERVFGKEVERDDLPSYVGRDVAARLLAAPKEGTEPKFRALMAGDVWMVVHNNSQGYNTPSVRNGRGGPTYFDTREEAEARAEQMNQALGHHTLSGSELEIGGDGMKGFYDKIVPQYLGKYVKKWGGQIEKLDVHVGRVKPVKAHYVGADYNLEHLRQRREDTAGFYGPMHTQVEKAVESGEYSSLKDYLERADLTDEGRQAIAKEFGGRISFSTEPVPSQQLAVPITPEMKRSVLEDGQPLFQLKRARQQVGKSIRDPEEKKVFEEALALFESQLDLFRPEQLELGLKKGEIDPKEQGARRAAEAVTRKIERTLSRGAGEDLRSGPRARGAGRLLAKAFRDFKDHGYIDLRGQRAYDAKELAALAQVFRDPRYETFRIIYISHQGRILAHEAFTSRHPLSAQVTPFEPVARLKHIHGIKRRMERLGAAGYYLMHNHPSGEVTPSWADIRATEVWSKMVPGLYGHIIINHKRFTYLEHRIDGSLNQQQGELPGAEDLDPIFWPEKSHAALLKNDLSTPAEIAKVAQKVQGEAKEVAIIYASRERIHAITAASFGEIFGNAKEPGDLSGRWRSFAGRLKRERQAYGGQKVFIALYNYKDAKLEERETLRDLHAAIVSDGTVDILNILPDGDFRSLRRYNSNLDFGGALDKVDFIRVNEPEGEELFQARPQRQKKRSSPPSEHHVGPDASGPNKATGGLNPHDMTGKLGGYITYGPHPGAGESGFLSGWENFYWRAFDEAAPVLKAQRMAKAEGVQVDDEGDLQYAIDRARGAGGAAKVFLEENFAPIYRGGKIGKETLDALTGDQIRDLDEYLVTKRIDWLYRHDKDFKEAAIPKTMAARLVKEFETESGGKLARRADLVWQYFRRLADMKLRTGVWTEKMHADITREPYYVPLIRDWKAIYNSRHKGEASGSRKAFSSINRLVRGINPHAPDAIVPVADPVTAAIMDTHEAFSESAKMQVWRKVLDLREKSPWLQKWIVEQAEGYEPKKDEEVVEVLKGGQRKAYTVPMELGDAVNNLGVEQLNTIVKTIAAVSNLFKRATVQWNPDFAFANLPRDQQEAALNTGKIPARLLLKGFMHWAKEDEVWRQYMKWGGAMDQVEASMGSAVQSADEVRYGRGSWKKPTSKLKARFEGLRHFQGQRKFFEAMKRAGRIPLEAAAILGEASEMATRLGNFEHALNMGFSKAKAANVARQGTLDFGRIGRDIKSANSMIPFLNAALQGVDKTVRTAKEDPARAAARWAVYGLTPMIALTAWNMQNPNYRDISAREKDYYWILMLSKTGTAHIKLAKAHWQKVTVNPIQMAIEIQGGTASKEGWAIAKDVVFGGVLPFEDVASPVPPLISIPLEQAANFDFFWERSIEKAPGLAPELRYDPFTSETLKTIAKGMARVTDGRLVWSPARMQHVLQGLGGGSTTNLLLALDIALGAATPQQFPELRKDRLPFVKRVYGVTQDWKADLEQQIREARRELDQAIQNAPKAGRQGRSQQQTQHIKRLAKRLSELQAAKKANDELMEKIRKKNEGVGE